MENFRPIIKTKKAQGFEAWFFVIVVLLAFAIFFVVLNYTWGRISPELESGLNASIPEGETSFNITKTMNQTRDSGLLFDKLLPFLIIGLFGFILIMAGAIIRHPIMIFVGIIILGVVLTLSVIYSNVYNAITETSEFASTKADMPIQDKLMKWLPVVVFLMGLAIAMGIIISRGGSGY